MDKDQKRHEQIEKVTKAMPYIIAVVGVLYVVLFYVFILKPKIGRIIKGGQYDLTPVETMLQQETAYRNSLKKYLSSLDQVGEAYRTTVSNIVPNSTDFPGLIVTLDAIATKHHLVMNALDVGPTEQTTDDGRGIIAGVANFQGGDYAVMKAFLRDLERSRRVMDIRSIQFSPGGGSFAINFWTYAIGDAMAP